MNNTDAKSILRSFRPDGQDAADPAFRPALDQADRDPELRNWFHDERALDQVVSGRLNEVEPPAGLLHEILAIQAVAPVPFLRGRGRRWLALAAVFVLLLGGALHWLAYSGPAPSFDAFPGQAARILGRPFQLDVTAAGLDEATQWLQARRAAWDLPVSEHLAAAAERGVGCKTFRWQGRELFLVCFFLDDGSVAHLVMMDADALRDVPGADRAPQWARHGSYTTAAWTDGDRAYVLASKTNMAELQALL
jgi:hypothetical protein